MWLWDWLSGKRRRRARMNKLAGVLVGETLFIMQECERKHFRAEGADHADVAAAKAMSGAAYLALALQCAEELELTELVTLAAERYASSGAAADHASSGTWLDALEANRMLVRKEVGSVGEDAPRDRLVACVVTLLKRPAIARYGETATYFKAGSVCDEAVVAEEIVGHFEKTRGTLIRLRGAIRG